MMNKDGVFTAVCAGIIAVSGFIAVPIGPVGIPIVLQNMMVVLAAGILGVRGAIATAIFLIGGALGLPVFAGGKGGLAPFFAPAGGYLVGYFFSALWVGVLMGRPKIESLSQKALAIKIALVALSGFIIIYAFGLTRLATVIMQTQSLPFYISLKAAFFSGMVPYLIGDFLKLVLVIILIKKLRPYVLKYF
jgi:biotin transport system substrate-specific component